MDIASISNVIGITIICYLVAIAIKATPLDSKWLPVICGALGAVLGVIGMLCMPDYPASDIITALAVGIVSGLAATGTNQVYKQLKGSSDEEEKEEE